MRSALRLCIALALGCVTGTAFGSDSALGRFTLMSDGRIAVHARSGPDAIMSSNGDLSIGDTRLRIDQNQRDLVARYFAKASDLRQDGFATGMAGLNTAVTALTSVVSGLASGDPDSIGDKVEAKAAKIEVHVARLCVDLRELASTQNALA